MQPSDHATHASQRFALLALILGAVAIGCSPIFVRLSDVGPMATAFWRTALALIPILAFSAFQKNEMDARPETWVDYVWLMVPGVALGADLAAWHLSLQLTSVANATLLANLAPVFVTLIGWLVFRSAVTRIFLLGLVIALAGVVTLKGGPVALADGDLRGDSLAMVAAFFYAIYILSVGRLRSRFSTMTIMTWSTLAAALSMLPLAFFFEDGMMPVTFHGWAIVIGLAFICHAGGQFAIAYALAYLPPAFSSLTLLVQPVVAAFLAWILLSEPVGAWQGIGGVMVLAGILVARRSK